MMRQEEEEFRRHEEEIRQEEMRRQQEEMRRQEQMRIQAQEEERMRQEMERKRQEEEMARQAEIARQEEERQMQMRIQQEEQQRQLQQQQYIEQQQMMQQQQMQEQQQMQQQQQFSQQQSFQTTQEQKISSITKTGGFSYGAIPTKEPKALPPMSSSSMSFESSQSQSQQFSSVQTSSFAQEQSKQEVYESQEFNGGVMKGYRRKDELSNEFSSEQNNRGSGIFGGINGDCNQLVNEEFDYKKHSVKDLAKHFALVKPKKNIPQNILPEQRMFNGDHAPQLNYLGAGAENGQVVQGQQQSRREVSQQDIEASKAAYEMKKKQQMEAQQQTQTSSSTSSSKVVRRTETSSSEQKTERRMSLRDSLMLDPAKAHADAGLIDPSAILRGSDITGRRSTSESLNQSVPGETDKVMNKWDNHNTIARGWAGVKANYHPVTFRNIYNVDSQNQTSSIQL